MEGSRPGIRIQLQLGHWHLHATSTPIRSALAPDRAWKLLQLPTATDNAEIKQSTGGPMLLNQDADFC